MNNKCGLLEIREMTRRTSGLRRESLCEPPDRGHSDDHCHAPLVLPRLRQYQKWTRSSRKERRAFFPPRVSPCKLLFGGRREFVP